MSAELSKYVVQVLERRPDGNLWPVATVNVMSGGAVLFAGQARTAFGPLLDAARKATAMLVLGDIHTRLAAQQLVTAKIETEEGAV